MGRKFFGIHFYPLAHARRELVARSPTRPRASVRPRGSTAPLERAQNCGIKTACPSTISLTSRSKAVAVFAAPISHLEVAVFKWFFSDDPIHPGKCANAPPI